MAFGRTVTVFEEAFWPEIGIGGVRGSTDVRIARRGS